jgi:hypothetical protein
MLLATIIGLASTALLVFAGYIWGAKHGSQRRRQLLSQQIRMFRQQSHINREELQHLRQQINEQRRFNKASEKGVGEKIEAVLSQGNELRQMVEPLIKRETEFQNFYMSVQQTLNTLMQPEQSHFDLSDLTINSKHRSELTRLLDQMAEKARLTTVMISDEAGLPLAFNSHATQTDRMAALSSLIVLLSERISRNNAPAPLSVIIYDEANTQTLCRIFQVNQQKLFLIAQSVGVHLTPTSLDAALPKVDSLLSPQVIIP